MSATIKAPMFKASIWFALLFLACLIIPALGIAQDSQKPADQQDTPKMLELWSPGDKGQRMRIRGRVTGTDGKPIPNATIRLKHADSEGFDRSYHQGQLKTNEKGLYQFGSVVPGFDHRISHIHVYITHPDYKGLETEFYFKDDPKVDPDNPDAIFLEEGTIDDIKMKYGRWDVTLTPK